MFQQRRKERTEEKKGWIVQRNQRGSSSLWGKRGSFVFLGLGLLLLWPRWVEASTPSSRPSSRHWNIWEIQLNRPGSAFRLGATIETGFLGVLSHTIRFGKGGSTFDYVKDGSQNVLFPFLRFGAEVTLFQRHSLIFLYQPLDLQTQTVLGEDLVQDVATFNKGEVLDLRYGFDFYRLSYLYDLLASPRHELSIGLSLQIRNATIVFSTVDGSKRSFRNDLGPVPILKSRGRFSLPYGLWLGFEIDGFYAPVSYLNGSDNEVVGAIVDASLRIGKSIAPFFDVFLNARYVGGGAVGTEQRPSEPGSDGQVENWIHLFSVSLGFSLR